MEKSTKPYNTGDTVICVSKRGDDHNRLTIGKKYKITEMVKSYTSDKEWFILVENNSWYYINSNFTVDQVEKLKQEKKELKSLIDYVDRFMKQYETVDLKIVFKHLLE